MGTLLYWNRRYDDSIVQFGKVLEIQPDFPYAYAFRARAYAAKGMYKESLADLKKATALEGRPGLITLGRWGRLTP